MRSTLELSTAMQVPQGELQFAPLEAECMNCRLEMIVMAWLFLGGLSPAQTRTGPHDPEKRQAGCSRPRGLMAARQRSCHARPYARHGVRSRGSRGSFPEQTAAH